MLTTSNQFCNLSSALPRLWDHEACMDVYMHAILCLQSCNLCQFRTHFPLKSKFKFRGQCCANAGTLCSAHELKNTHGYYTGIFQHTILYSYCIHDNFCNAIYARLRVVQCTGECEYVSLKITYIKYLISNYSALVMYVRLDQSNV